MAQESTEECYTSVSADFGFYFLASAVFTVSTLSFLRPWKASRTWRKSRSRRRGDSKRSEAAGGRKEGNSHGVAQPEVAFFGSFLRYPSAAYLPRPDFHADTGSSQPALLSR